MLKSKYYVIGVMSGTSLDGIDLIYAKFNFSKNWSFNLIGSETINYAEHWKTTLSGLVNQSADELLHVDIEYSKYLATVITKFIKEHNIEFIDFISSHGHTALHQPQKGLTYQIGNQQILANEIGKKIICDFRVQDVKFGGQGAPLVPIGDRLLFKKYKYCLNLGGFANISFESKNERIAYDICPVNIILNHYVNNLALEFDDKGIIASSGKINIDLLNQLNQLSFYADEPPKSLGLEWVKLKILPLIDSFQLEIKDVLRTFVEHIAVQIAANLKDNNAEVLITGGGVYNDFLIDRLKFRTSITMVIPDNEIVEFKEALIFGFLGVLKERGEVNCLKSVTGADRNHSSGKILLPSP
ncbi:anhydro-N-acetylmuramic acid kinase [Winogradskyella ursingii]|uniref:anhydro-N-acetylmuramic acid kinase n=1 Tax=Winogradskyella ursingii TaxID=2686079 RepID=UPI0015C99AF2|nr:anhydro-N-acetylmuramic acid kinase [Winogradskyella ursingii]